MVHGWFNTDFFILLTSIRRWIRRIFELVGNKLILNRIKRSWINFFFLTIGKRRTRSCWKGNVRFNEKRLTMRATWLDFQWITWAHSWSDRLKSLEDLDKGLGGGKWSTLLLRTKSERKVFAFYAAWKKNIIQNCSVSRTKHANDVFFRGLDPINRNYPIIDIDTWIDDDLIRRKKHLANDSVFQACWISRGQTTVPFKHPISYRYHFEPRSNLSICRDK